MAVIGIDLGTTNSLVAHLRGTPQIIQNHSSPMTPSVVAFDTNTGEVIVGQAAKNQAGEYPAVFEAKYFMGKEKTYSLGDRTYTPIEISSLVLADLKRAAEEYLGEPIDAVVVTVPAYFDGAAKAATLEAATKAGLPNVRLLEEPIAAALAFQSEATVLVYDFGGGTFDVAIIDRFDNKLLAVGGNNQLGGKNLDERLRNHVLKQVRERTGVDLSADPLLMHRLKLRCEQAKIALSQQMQATIEVFGNVNGKTVVEQIKVTRAEFEALIADLVDSTMEKVAEVIRHAAEKEPGFDKERVQEILLVGGTTHIPLVQRKLTEFFGKEPAKRVNPDWAVALGAALHTATGAMPADVHQVRLDPLPVATPEPQCRLRGRTSPRAQITITGGAGNVACAADERGRFEALVELKPGAVNDLTVVATNAAGEARKTGAQVRHDPNLKEVQRGQEPGGEIKPILTRAIGVNVTGDDQRLAILMPARAEPHTVVNRDFFMVSRANQPGRLTVQVYEGELPFAPLNTLLGEVQIETNPSVENPQLEVTFGFTENQMLEVTVLIVPTQEIGRAVFQYGGVKSAHYNVVERTEHVLGNLGDKIRPDDRARLTRQRQAVLDLCEQYKKEQTRERYGKIKEAGLQLRAELDRIEKTYG